MCGSGNRSQRAAELLTEKGFKCLNVSDGFRVTVEKNWLEK